MFRAGGEKADDTGPTSTLQFLPRSLSLPFLVPLSKILLYNIAGPRTNVWSSTFDPGANANLKKVGSSYYDKPVDNKGVWDMHNDAESARPKSTSTAAPGPSDAMDTASLRRMLSGERVEAALKQADPTGQGKVDYNQFMELLKNPSA